MAEVLDYKDKKVSELPEGVVAVKLSTTWCMPCKTLSQSFPKIENATLAAVDADDETSEFLGLEFGVRNIPTTLIFKDGVYKSKVVGDKPDAIQAAINAEL